MNLGHWFCQSQFGWSKLIYSFFTSNFFTYLQKNSFAVHFVKVSIMQVGKKILMILKPCTISKEFDHMAKIRRNAEVEKTVSE